MKTLVSSKTFFDTLIKSDNFDFNEMRIIDDKIILKKDDTQISIPCQFEGATAWLPCYSIRFESVLAVVKNISERPLVINLEPNRLQITIEF
jgi:hypothetical protein